MGMAVFNKRRIVCSLLFFVGIPFLCYWAIGFTARSIVSPERRAVQSYHRDWLENPQQHGLRIQSHLCLDDTTPCLLVTPVQNRGPAKRGQLIREQLGNKNYNLDPYGTIKGTVVLLHGRNGRKEDLLAVAERFCAVGFRCLLPDLPAHGESKCETTSYGLSDFDQSFADSVLQEMAAEYHFEDNSTYLWGMSMGGAFTSAALKNTPNRWNAAVIVCSFDSLPNIIEDKAQAIMPFGSQTFAKSVINKINTTHSIDCSQIKPSQWLANSDTPILFAHGTDDSLISMDRGLSLYQHAGCSNKKWVEVKNADHNNILVTPMPLFSEMAAWFLDDTARNPKRDNSEF